jgi:hypothetical protein
MTVMYADIHEVAQQYLDDIESGTAGFYSREPSEVVAVAEPVERVVITRDEYPQYLAGIKPSGRPVWTHCIRLAASYDYLSSRALAVLERMEVYGIPVETMPATWFSNYQGA